MITKRFSLTIFRKGLLLVAIPLVAEAIYIGVLNRVEAEAAAAQRWAVHTKDVIAKVEETYRRLLEGYAGVRNLIASSDTSVAHQMQRGTAVVPALLEEIRTLVSDNPAQQARV